MHGRSEEPCKQKRGTFRYVPRGINGASAGLGLSTLGCGGAAPTACLCRWCRHAVVLGETVVSTTARTYSVNKCSRVDCPRAVERHIRTLPPPSSGRACRASLCRSRRVPAWCRCDGAVLSTILPEFPRWDHWLRAHACRWSACI